MIFCFHFFLFLLVTFLYLIHVAGCDDARGQGDDSNADNRGDDADDATDGGDGVNVTIAYRGERTGCPIEGVEEIVEQQLARCRVDILFGIEHDERRDEDVEERQPQDYQQNAALLVDDTSNDVKRFVITDDLEDAKQLEQSRHTEHLERGTQQVEDGQYRQHVDNGHRGEWIQDESYNLVVL